METIPEIHARGNNNCLPSVESVYTQHVNTGDRLMNIAQRTRLNIHLALSLAACIATTVQAQDSVEYHFEFVSEWSVETHPQSFPSNAHYSSVVGMNHIAGVELWMPGGIASPGIERMAETGSVSIISDEIQVHVDNGVAEKRQLLGPLASSPGVRTRDFTMTRHFPLMSLVTMIAPSPDWFVGVHDINLRPGGVWARDIIIDVYPYDSGSDSGVNYNSPNADITPHLPIANISNIFPFTGTPRIGTFRFTLLSDAGCSQADLAEPYGELNFFDVSEFIAAFTANDVLADFNNDGLFNFFDVSDFLSSFAEGCP